MNTTNLPGFTAEASLYIAADSYYGNTWTSKVGAPAAIVPQQSAGCTVLCSDWIGCNSMCGLWPPDLHNYQCWFDCLKPTIDCLQGATCLPTPCGATGCAPGQVCCDAFLPQRCTTVTVCNNQKKALCGCPVGTRCCGKCVDGDCTPFGKMSGDCKKTCP
jgi:hypothetical protein